ncbi:AAA domain-containing protein [Haloferula chungangensis]|uniref:AAA domain-containing protein n=1 Tax=Haloferula chungangensis TaxID=1048331 RepID=A0ABW2L7X1_9BACT
MILETMLQRLYQSMLKGPSLNVRPHNSRQRVDVAELLAMGYVSETSFLKTLLDEGKVEISAKAERFKKPAYPEAEWSDQEKRQRDAWEKEVKLLRKLAGIAADAKEYYNDHGEDALFVGFPILSLPPKDDREMFGTSRILAPLAMVPISLTVRTGARAGVTIKAVAEGADRLIPNPALLAWIEKMTGASSDELFADDSGEEPWQELKEILAFVAKGVGLDGLTHEPEKTLLPVPRADGLGDSASLLPSAVLGLFPMTNPGLIRDTQWMMANEADLEGPVRSFLVKEAINPEEDQAPPEAEEHEVATQAKFERDFESEFFITRADPCQAAAVEEAARSQALVVHGPPGTGKSQTIANIIGDHLARGERVLFVCDKRTALDVVKYRLDALGIGHLCGVIHDPQRDRKELYMGLRQRLDELVEEGLPPDSMPALGKANKRLSSLHRELREAYASLHAEDAEGESFHSLVGRWLEHEAGPDVSDVAQEVTRDLVESHRADISELCDRAVSAKLTGNVLLDCLEISLSDYLSAKPDAFEEKLRDFSKALRLSGDDKELPPLPNGDLEMLGKNRARLAELVKEGANDLGGPLMRGILDAADTTPIRREWEDTAVMRELLKTPLDRELALQVKGSEPALGVINQSLVALQEYEEASRKWTKLFAFGKKKAASSILASLGQGVDEASIDRGISFFKGLKARIVVGDFVSRMGAEKADGFDDEARLNEAVRLIGVSLEMVALLKGDKVLESSGLRMSLSSNTASAEADRLAVSAKRASDLLKALNLAKEQSVLSEKAIAEWGEELRNGLSGTDLGIEIESSSKCLEGVLRVQDCLSRLPDALGHAARKLALEGVDAADALVCLTRAGIENRLRKVIADHPDLARIDTTRIDAAFGELGERLEEKRELVQRVLIRYWQERQTMKTLARTGSRLSPVGSSLRQRLYVRGKKALRLRQMIAAGKDVEGGDPLFDLCPVWMASPDTVAQIFPRECLFDIAIFDEASQCRLEEALPVLLRAKRLVVAGDPKQLPPTRFFESSVVDSGDGDFEDDEDLHAHQMSEMEDLLGAALNLDVSEAFLDVHYRSRNESLIGFSNESFYGHRLQPIPGHPKNKALSAPIRLTHVDGIYKDQTNPAEALAVVERITEILDDAEPPSIGVATFNLKQRNLILELLDDKCAEDSRFASQLDQARRRKGADSFEGLFVKNLENVQGDERDVMIISTTFGRDETGRFRRNFGALSRVGGERRLNVLVTRARSEIHVLTSIPREEYQAGLAAAQGAKPNGRVHLYSYLCYAERLESLYKRYHDTLEHLRASEQAECEVLEIRQPSSVASALGAGLRDQHGIGSTVHWGNDGFSVDVALTHPAMPEDVTIGILTDFNRYRNTPDPIDWELFRTTMHRSQGWDLERVWSPRLFRDFTGEMDKIADQHRESAIPESRLPNERAAKEERDLT